MSRVGAYLSCWSGRRDSNARHLPWQGSALPAELLPPPREPAVFTSGRCLSFPNPAGCTSPASTPREPTVFTSRRCLFFPNPAGCTSPASTPREPAVFTSRRCLFFPNPAGCTSPASTPREPAVFTSRRCLFFPNPAGCTSPASTPREPAVFTSRHCLFFPSPAGCVSPAEVGMWRGVYKKEKPPRRPTLPGCCHPSTIGATSFHDPVRHGKGWFRSAVSTGVSAVCGNSKTCIQNWVVMGTAVMQRMNESGDAPICGCRSGIIARKVKTSTDEHQSAQHLAVLARLTS